MIAIVNDRLLVKDISLKYLRLDRQNDILQKSRRGGVPELADGLDLGSSAAMRGGSSPPFPTKITAGINEFT